MLVINLLAIILLSSFQVVIKWSSHYWSVLLNEFNGKPAVSTPKRSHTPQKGAVYSSPFGNKGSPRLLSTQSPLKTSKGWRREGRRRGERVGGEGGREGGHEW